MKAMQTNNSKPKVEGAKPAPLNSKKIDEKTKIYLKNKKNWQALYKGLERSESKPKKVAEKQLQFPFWGSVKKSTILT